MYPRPGAPLLPAPLRSLVERRPVPPRVIARHELPKGLKLGDLNATVCARFSEAAIAALGDEVAEALRRHRWELSSARDPLFEQRPALDELDLSRRAQNALILGGFTVDGRVRPSTVGELARTPGVGVHTLLEILSSPAAGAGGHANGDSGGAISVRAPTPSRAVRAAAATLVSRRWSPHVGADDPRLGPALQALHPHALTAREAGELLRDETFLPGEARRVARQIRDFVARADALRRLPLSRELADLVEALTPAEGARRVVLARTGLGGRAPAGLKEAAAEIGVTRERARQIAAAFEKQLKSRQYVWTPVLDRTLKALRSLLPGRAPALQRALLDAGLLTPAFDVVSLVAVARLLGRPPLPEYRAEIDAIVPAGALMPFAKVRTTAHRLVEHRGATTVADVAERLEEQAVRADETLLPLALETIDGFRWLDRDRGWFWIRGGRNRLLNQIEKIVAVAGTIELGELRTGTSRHYRMRGVRLPRDVLAALCVDSGLYTFDGERIAGGPELPDWRDVLGAGERALVEILFDHGLLMRSDELERLAVDEGGLNRSSFYSYLSYSPVLERYAPGVWGLRGAPATAAKVDVLIPPRVRRKVLQDHGWTPDGRLWIAYRISPAAVRSGVLGVPVALQTLLRGQFELAAEDDQPVGTLVAEEQLWGLSPFFRSRRVEAGDMLVISADLAARRALVEVGDDELLLHYQAGDAPVPPR